MTLRKSPVVILSEALPAGRQGRISIVCELTENCCRSRQVIDRDKDIVLNLVS